MKKALSEPVIKGPDNIEITWSGVLFLLVIFMLVSINNWTKTYYTEL